MRRFQILFFWLFSQKNNVSFGELIAFLLKPKVSGIARRYLREVTDEGAFQKVLFEGVSRPLYWPSRFPVQGVEQVTAETFDTADWHYYRKPQTPIETGDILLDIGTAEGLFPLVVLDQCEKLFLVEPSSSFGDALEQTFRDAADKVTIFRTAIGNQDGEIGFDERSLDGQVSASGTPTPIRKVDSLIKPGQRITYLKADIEGFELEMLKGAARTIAENKPKIAITTYHEANDAEQIIALVKSYVPEYKCFVKGIFEKGPKPVMIHFWI